MWDDFIEIGVLGRCLAVVDYSSHEFVDVWIRCGEIVSWLHAFTLQIFDVVSLIPLYFLNNGEFLFSINDRDVVCCDPSSYEDGRELGI
ncbi:hypothetical protein IFM89_016953 [Coptis chinensis]|uniref:F-box associated domain-containing protein n=1 Tax=Coptis chinensis TaxID=261450 RepID=A0A835HV78_9MAGN|nr:hypothetical protein IFM89_016953 [Coptis chinensis]